MEEADIWRAARQLIRDYGADARSQAIHFAAKMREQGNDEGYAVWGLVWTAIKVLQEKADVEPS